jgi:hypothetical protein
MQHHDPDDLATDKDGTCPANGKGRAFLIKTMRRWQKPIALFIDDGHDLALQKGARDNTPQAISLSRRAL